MLQQSWAWSILVWWLPKMGVFVSVTPALTVHGGCMLHVQKHCFVSPVEEAMKKHFAALPCSRTSCHG